MRSPTGEHDRRAGMDRDRRAADTAAVEADMPRGDHRLRDAARARKAQIPEQLVQPDAACCARSLPSVLARLCHQRGQPGEGLFGDGPRRTGRSGRSVRGGRAPAPCGCPCGR